MTHVVRQGPPGAGGDGGHWRRWVGLGVLVFGIGAIVLHLIGREPVLVEVAYHYGAAAAGLRRTVIRYQDKGDVLRRVAFSYAARSADERQLHAVRLPRGEYRLLLTLIYEEGAAPQIEGARRVEAQGPGEALRLERPLTVRDAGRVHVYVVGQPAGGEE